MAAGSKNIANQYLEYSDAQYILERDEFMIETHRPKRFKSPYHHHASVELNFVSGCDLHYSFSGTPITLPQERITLFWGTVPHGVVGVDGSGRITNIYLSLAQFLKWGLPKPFINAVIGGAIISANDPKAGDHARFAGWARDYKESDPSWRRLLLGEIEMRLRRLALEGYTVLMEGGLKTDADGSGATVMRYIDEMLRYIADNYGGAISVAAVADHVGLSTSYAMALFRRSVGVGIKEHITRIKLSHAQMLLANSELKILSVAMDSGFGSLSSFYDSFHHRLHQTPAAFRRQARQG